jgi:acetylornithine deacetylase/succinyl-diaminopimelate desuccinylase-like protein
VVTRLAGEDPSASALVVHGHLDVVPALRDQWTVDPFGAELKDGLIWGRGAVDMKDMDAMILSVLRNFARTGRKPKRDPHLRVLRRRGSRRHLRRPLRRRQAARTL